jgi:hypothetical protein
MPAGFQRHQSASDAGKGTPVPTKQRRYRIDVLAEMSVPALVDGYRAGTITFDELCDTVRRRPYRATRDALQHLRTAGQLSAEEHSSIEGELLCTHLQEFF